MFQVFSIDPTGTRVETHHYEWRDCEIEQVRRAQLNHQAIETATAPDPDIAPTVGKLRRKPAPRSRTRRRTEEI